MVFNAPIDPRSGSAARRVRQCGRDRVQKLARLDPAGRIVSRAAQRKRYLAARYASAVYVGPPARLFLQRLHGDDGQLGLIVWKMVEIANESIRERSDKRFEGLEDTDSHARATG